MSWAEEQYWFGTEDMLPDNYLYGSDYDMDLEKIEYKQDSKIEYIAYPAWRMNNGELIAIRDMTTQHIKNCIRMIYRRNGTWRNQYLRHFEAELRKRKFINHE